MFFRKGIKSLLAFNLLIMSSICMAQFDTDSTVITSDQLEMVQSETKNHFYFYGNVVVESADFRSTSSELEVISLKEDTDKPKQIANEPEEAMPMQVGTIEQIIAIGDVNVKQEGRSATAGKAVIIPAEEKIILTESPIVTDSQGTVSGYRMTLIKGESRAIVEGNPNGERSKVVLPAMPAFGTKKPEEKQQVVEKKSSVKSKKQKK